MFSTVIKKTVLDNLEGCVSYLLKEHPDIKQRLDIPVELFSIDEELMNLKEFQEFVNVNRQLIRDKYNLLVKPRLQIIEDKNQDMEKSLLLHFFEDFYQYAVYKCVEADNFTVTFNDLWKFFEDEFFAQENIFEFQARLKNVYYHGGIGLENIIPWGEVDAFWARSALDYRMLGWERNGGIHYKFMEYFQPSWIVLRKKSKVGKTQHILTACKEAEDQFNLFTFVVRNISKGDAYFNDIRYFGLGHFSPDSTFGVSWHSVKDNDIYEEFGEYTTIENPWDWTISKVLEKCDPSSYKDYSFADWHLRLNGKFKFPFDAEYSDTRKQYYLYEKILNASFVFNSLLPDIKDKNGFPSHRDNKVFREDYLPEVLSKYSGIDKAKAKSTIISIYDVRNKIAHGKPQEAVSALTSIGNFKDIEDKIHLFNYTISRLILISLANSDFKIRMDGYYTSKNLTTLPTLINPFA